MSSFTKNLTITKIKIKKRRWIRLWFQSEFVYLDMWRVDKEFNYHVGSKDNADIVYVPKGFVTDGASIPKFAWPIVGHPLEKYAQAAVVHDFLYNKQTRTRVESDAIFYEAMGVLKVVKWKRMIMYGAVRVGGWIPWNKRARVLNSD